MVGELYQLVAIDKEGHEQVIKLNNENKNSKGFLFYIDSGTTYMKSKESLVDYLMMQGKISNPDVTFVIKYNNRGVRYLPVIYNDPELRNVSLCATDTKKMKHYVEYLFDKIDPEVCNSNFYNYISELNDDIFSQIINGNYLNTYIFEKLRKYNEMFGIVRENMAYKEKYKRELVNLFDDYKSIRTLYIFYKCYINAKSNNLNENIKYDIPECVQYILPDDVEDKGKEIPQHLQKAHEQNGMDGVYALEDNDELIQKGYKFK